MHLKKVFVDNKKVIHIYNKNKEEIKWSLIDNLKNRGYLIVIFSSGKSQIETTIDEITRIVSRTGSI